MGTIEYVDGFDDYTGPTAATFGWNIAFSAFVAGRVTGQAAAFSNTFKSRNITPDARYAVDIAWSTSSSVGSSELLRFTGAAVRGKVGYNGNGTFTVYRNTTAIATTSAISVASYAWYHIGFDYDCAGNFILKFENVQLATGATGDSGDIDNFLLFGSTAATQYFDDLVLTKGGGLQGDCRIVTQFGNANGTDQDWDSTIPAAWQANGTRSESTGAITVAWPTHQIDDVALLLTESCGGEAMTLTTASGFVECDNSPQYTGSGTSGVRLHAYWCRATSAAMASAVFADPGDHCEGIIVTFRGLVKNGTPIDVTSGGVKAAASTSVTITGVTTTVANALVVAVATRDDDVATAEFSNWANANLTSVTEQVDTGTLGGNGGGIAVMTGYKAAAGATGDTTADVVSSVNAFMTIALKPGLAVDAVSENLPGHDTDVSYISTATAGDRATFSFPDLGVVGTVKAVAINHVSRKDDAGTRLVVTTIRGTSDHDNATTQTLSASYVGQQQIYEQDPEISGAWTTANVDAREYGIKLDT